MSAFVPLSDRLTGRAALVTGSSRGLGRAIALYLAWKGARVAVHYRTQAAAAQAVLDEIHALGGTGIILGGDLAAPPVAGQLVEQTIAAFGSCDILVNNAAELLKTPTEATSDEDWERTINVNLNAVFRACRAAIPHMKAQRWGRIIALTSQAALTGSRENAHYAASKSALSGLTYSLTKELAPFGITVNQVSVGRVVTDMLLSIMDGREEEWLRQTPAGRFGQPEEVAAAVAFLASDSAAYINGHTLHVNGGQLMS